MAVFKLIRASRGRAAHTVTHSRAAVASTRALSVSRLSLRCFANECCVPVPAALAPCHPDMLAAAATSPFAAPPPPPALPPVGAYDYDEQPVSRTYQYRKVMKPMLERKRRARINRCLDELKELMVSALAAEGENVAKLEKADILELTVRHLHRLRRRRRLAATPEAAYADRFRAGFSQCAAEVSQFLSGADPAAAARVLPHLGACLGAASRTARRAALPAPPTAPPPPRPPNRPRRSRSPSTRRPTRHCRRPSPAPAGQPV
ncbi:Protein deadpan [Gryllus bimaculatus]|nr:Protein deadpan [Gryllus bimaculatus]